MTKTEAQSVLDAIHATQTTKVNVEPGIQLVVNGYVDNWFKMNPTKKVNSLRWEFDKKGSNLNKAFQDALWNKIKEMRRKREESAVKPVPIEERILLPEAAKMLEMTSQNLNYLLRNHPEINVITVSARKRYLTKTEINKIRNLGK